MEAVIIPSRTIVYINGIPVELATDIIVEVAYGNMHRLIGYHYAHIHEASDVPVKVEDKV